MREIKFRAWDTKLGKWLFGFHEVGGFALMGECIICGEWPPGPMERWKDYVVEQYTGLKDKNGREIYEGDVVQEGGLVGHIKWDERHAAFVCDQRAGSAGMYLQRMEIIGNIHENPELVKP